MTVALAAKCDSGVVVASDTLITVGDTQLQLKHLKGEALGAFMFVLYAGRLDVIQRIVNSFDGISPWDFQNHLWQQVGVCKKESAEYLVVYESELYLLSNLGDLMSGYDYACIGSEFGWVGLDIIMSDLRNPTFTNVKNKLFKVMRAVSHRDNTVGGPYMAELV